MSEDPCHSVHSLEMTPRVSFKLRLTMVAWVKAGESETLEWEGRDRWDLRAAYLGCIDTLPARHTTYCIKQTF